MRHHDHQLPRGPEAECLQSIDPTHGPGRCAETSRTCGSREFSETRVDAVTDKACSIILDPGGARHSNRAFELAVEPGEVTQGGDDCVKKRPREQHQRLRGEGKQATPTVTGFVHDCRVSCHDENPGVDVERRRVGVQGDAYGWTEETDHHVGFDRNEAGTFNEG